MIEEPKINRNLALELLRVTEAGALAAAPLQGRGNKEAADARAVEAIRTSLATVWYMILTFPVARASLSVTVGSYFAWIGQIGMQLVLPAHARRPW